MGITYEKKGSDDASSPEAPKLKLKSRSTQTLPTERISFQKQIDLLRVYAAVSGPARKVVKLEEVEGIIKMQSSTISLANPFFTAVGLLQKSDRGFIPSEAVMNYQRAYQWNPETATHKLAPAIAGSWFAQGLMPTLQFRGMSEDEAINVLADLCSATPDAKPQLRLLLEYMLVAGLVTNDNGSLRANLSAPTAISPAGPSAEPEAPAAPAPRAAGGGSPASAQEGVIQFHVSVRVDMAQLSTWDAARITSFFAGIAQVLAAKGELEKSGK